MNPKSDLGLWENFKAWRVSVLFNLIFGRRMNPKSEPSANWSGASVKSSAAKGANGFMLARMDCLLGRQPIHMTEFGGI